jgi:hypothetical protein
MSNHFPPRFTRQNVGLSISPKTITMMQLPITVRVKASKNISNRT